jgi:hypothetical protein
LVQWSALLTFVAAVALILHQAPAPLVDSDPAAAARLAAKLEALAAGFASGKHRELRLSEAELNSFLQSNLALKPNSTAVEAKPPQKGASAASPNSPRPAEKRRALGYNPPQDAPAPAQGNPTTAPEADPTLEQVQSSVREVKVTLTEDRVQAYVLFDFHSRDFSLILDGRLHVAGGYLRFEPTSGKIGSLPLPQSALDSAVTRLLNAPENREKMRVPPEIRDIRVQNGELLVEYN